MSNKPPCRFFNTPNGCRLGTKCKFSHSNSSPSRANSPSRSSSAPNSATRSPRGAALSSKTSSTPSTPRDVCSYFWKEGRCKREFQCRFRHVQHQSEHTLNNSSPTSSSVISPNVSSLRASIAPFLTEKGLAKIGGQATDGFFAQDGATSLSPSDAHSHLRRFLFDNYQFKGVFEVYAFVRILASANTSNNLWTQEEGQILLTTMTSTNGSRRLVEVINWPDISMQAGSNRQTLSFQRGILPLLRYISSEFVVKSILITHVNQLYTITLQNLEKFAQCIESCIDQAMQLRSFADLGSPNAGTPIDLQVFASVAEYLNEVLVRFKNAVHEYPQLSILVKKLSQWFSEWSDGVRANPPIFRDPVGSGVGNSSAVRELLIGSVAERIVRLSAIVDREEHRREQSLQAMQAKARKSVLGGQNNEALVAALHTHFEGPGTLRANGPRHDNDNEDIYDIRIPPTHQELLSHNPPYLPANFFDAPHHQPADSIQRLLDIEFRLLREELTAPLRKAVQLVHSDLRSTTKTRLDSLIEKRGGKYHGISDSTDSIMFNVYTGVKFLGLNPGWKGMSTSLRIDSPPGKARANGRDARLAFWDIMGGKRLMTGGLIALVWASATGISIHLGTISSSFRDSEIKEQIHSSREHIKLQVTFFDPDIELRVLQSLRSDFKNQDRDTKLLVESPVMFEAIRPFLLALKTEPTMLPFSKYLAHRPAGYLESCTIDPPRYSTHPNFTFQLSSLFPVESGVTDLRLCSTDPDSIEFARQELQQSRLDPSQADAVVDALTREVALIQGPPGTGKSFTGVEILRVLRDNDIGPILMIAFTNHALDHILTSVLDAGITRSIVRLGRQSNDERIKSFSIERLEMARDNSRLDRSFASQRQQLKATQLSIAELMRSLVSTDVASASDLLMKHMQFAYPEHYEYLSSPPGAITKIGALISDEGEVNSDAWKTVGRGGKVQMVDDSIYAFWRQGRDLNFVNQVLAGNLVPWRPPSPVVDRTPKAQNAFSILDVENGETSDGDESDYGSIDEDSDIEEIWKNASYPQTETPPTSDSESDSLEPEVAEKPIEAPEDDVPDIHDAQGFLEALSYNTIPPVSTSDRSLEELCDDGENIWAMNFNERQRLHQFWVEEVRRDRAETQTAEFERLRESHASKLKECNEAREEARRNVLEGVDIIGCTTTGAAQLTSLLKALSPRVLLVEEAGQVMEAHILGSLVPSIEHLILIGDPLQLRPTLNNFSLSMDSRRGRELYRFDMSMMERLSSSGLAMSRIDVQRRMRPAISSLIRNTLYPGLEDHELVKQYPDVRGMGKNVFFLHHTHAENDGGDENTSKFNTYEVQMIRDLVLYLLRQGTYSDEGDIVVLCAYLGQLARLRDALAGEIAVVIDENDQAALDDVDSASENEGGSSVTIARVNVTKRVRLRTVDNYQGEEGEVVILSLVRNSGDPEDDDMQKFHKHAARPTIGFLKSRNRTNVALSRARQGLYIFGNAQNLANHSPMWGSIITELENGDNLGTALPVVCHRHPDQIEYISEPGHLAKIAPDGGCLRACDARLPCGHLCPHKCHCDDPKHISVVCYQRCRRLCPRNHPCTKVCSVGCGKCNFPVSNVLLPCGHTKETVPCSMLDALDSVDCDEPVDKALPSCEHRAILPCGKDESDHRCQERCASFMGCCSRECNANCSDCQNVNENNSDPEEPLIRHNHVAHMCRKDLQCGHRCQNSCSADHEHTTECKEACRQVCKHAQCKLACHVPCTPCREPCTWNCPHYTCPVACGSMCVRLPCDKPCGKTLLCGHKCPSVCGEDCGIQICLGCQTPDQNDSIADFVLQRTLEDLNPESGELDEMIITNTCRHAFTVETLDGITGLKAFYTFDETTSRWTGLQAPQGLVQPPLCPTCRATITSPRYSRVTKRADLDILERNVAAQMSRSLIKQQIFLTSFDKDASTAAINSSNVTLSTPKKLPKLNKQASARKASLNRKFDGPFSDHDISATNSSLFHNNAKLLDPWKKATHKLLAVYREVAATAGRRSAHHQAWESAFSFLYDRELQLGINDPSQFPRNISPQDHALRMATMQVGQPRPLADKRFVVEAFWLSLEIRFTIADLGHSWLREMFSHGGKQIGNFYRDRFAEYVSFLLQTCVQDAERAYHLSQSSGAARQAIKSALFCMRSEIRRFQFNFSMCKETDVIKNKREQLLEKAIKKALEAQQYMVDVIQTYFKRANLDHPAELTWIRENFSDLAILVVEEWEKIIMAIRMDTFYEEISLDEKKEIIKALGFATTGHYYTCPNGHIFVIGECGGAMQVSRCPECNESIGGSSHALLPSNAHSEEFARLAQEIDPTVRRSDLL